MKDKIENYLLNYKGPLDYETIYNDFIREYLPNNNSEEYVIKTILKNKIEKIKIRNNLIIERKNKLEKLKKLELPEQRSEEWYKLRKTRLTASSLASAIDNCHFQSRDELILDKIVEKPFEPNPITEWGVKYEDIAIQFYEELFNVKVLDFGMVPHPNFEAFGASPDGICDENGSEDHIARMVEIKCPPKRKFTKSVPAHYLMQVQGQLEVCDLDECDFFQVKIEEYNSYEDYCNDIFEIDGNVQNGRTHLNYPKGIVITFKKDEKLSYEYFQLNKSNIEIEKIVEEYKSKENMFEIKYWKIERYECTLVKRDRDWWIENVSKILDFYNDLTEYKNSPEKLETLKQSVEQAKKRKKKVEIKPLDEFQLISDSEDEN